MDIEQRNRERVEMITQRLTAALAPESLDVVDESHLHAGHAGARSGKGHFAVTVVAARFDGLSSVHRHRLIYEALGDAMTADIHALSINALTPAEV